MKFSTVFLEINIIISLINICFLFQIICFSWLVISEFWYFFFHYYVTQLASNSKQKRLEQNNTALLKELTKNSLKRHWCQYRLKKISWWCKTQIKNLRWQNILKKVVSPHNIKKHKACTNNLNFRFTAKFQ